MKMGKLLEHWKKGQYVPIFMAQKIWNISSDEKIIQSNEIHDFPTEIITPI